MSTYAHIYIVGQSYGVQYTEAILLEQPLDGYPSFVLAKLAKALGQSRAACAAYSKQASVSFVTEPGTELVAGNYLATTLSILGFGSRMLNQTFLWDVEDNPFRKTSEEKEKSYKKLLEPSRGLYVEWVYVVNLEDHTVCVLALPTRIVPHGARAYSEAKLFHTHPMGYAECMNPDYREPERIKTQKCIDDLKVLGYTVLPS